MPNINSPPFFLLKIMFLTPPDQVQIKPNQMDAAGLPALPCCRFLRAGNAQRGSPHRQQVRGFSTRLRRAPG